MPKSIQFDLDPRQTLIMSAFAFLLASIFSLGFFQSDEHFQILEFAAMKLGKVEESSLAWEYHHQMRPTFQPALVVVLHRLLGLININNPFMIATILRFLSGLLSFFAAYICYQSFKNKFKNPFVSKSFLYLSFLFWGAIFVGVRYSSESWSGSFLILGFSIYFLEARIARQRFIWSGICLGLAYLFRYQSAIAVAGFLLWVLFIKREQWSNLLIMGVALVGIAAIGVIIDRWFYGQWTFTLLHYFDQNIVQDKVSGFGVDPWWYYFEQLFVVLIPPFSLVPICLFIYLILKKFKHALVWALVPFLLVHILIGHKELRFLFPLVGFLPLIVAEGLNVYSHRSGIEVLRKKSINNLGKSFLVINGLLLLFVSLRPLDLTTPLYKEVYKKNASSITLYYLDTDPYQRALTVEYYRPGDLETILIKDLSGVHMDATNRTYLIAAKKALPAEDADVELALIYSALPSWTKYLNFNNWLDRTKVWHLYEISAKN